mmetsp:Transcript_49049/g.154010  ORF Transcript_49049/g.154010 Transcript_49049/m.154010 type:complete len:226 (+) Transcript_49049:69-746(+)
MATSHTRLRATFPVLAALCSCPYNQPLLPPPLSQRISSSLPATSSSLLLFVVSSGLPTASSAAAFAGWAPAFAGLEAETPAEDFLVVLEEPTFFSPVWLLTGLEVRCGASEGAEATAASCLLGREGAAPAAPGGAAAEAGTGALLFFATLLARLVNVTVKVFHSPSGFPGTDLHRHMDSTALVLGGPKIRSFSADDLMPDTGVSSSFCKMSPTAICPSSAAAPPS